jgi:hypothetical protein
MRYSLRALVIGVVIVIALAACSQAAPPAVAPTAAATSSVEGPTPIVTSVAGRFNPTEAVGGGAAGSTSVSDVARILAAVPQASQLKLSANASPPGAAGTEVSSVSIVAQDTSGLLKGLDKAGKQTLGEMLLNAAGEAWPNANVSLLVSDATGGGGTIIGTRPKGGPNSVIAT